MPIDPPGEGPGQAGPDPQPAPGGTGKTPPPLERTRFGGTERPHARAEADDTPVSRSDLSKGPEELLEHRSSRTNWRVLVISSAVILAFSIWTSLVPDQARIGMKAAVDWIATNLGWYYVLTVTLVIGFVLWVAFSKEGSVRLGPDHSRPQYGLGTWVAMLFAAGVGIDMLFYSVTGPVVQYLYPPAGEGASAEAVQDAVVWTMFHYGVAGWSMYALLGMAMGYFAYRWGEVERSAMVNDRGVEEPVLRVAMDTFRAFHYQVAAVEAPVPMFSGRMSRETDVYYRLEVFTQTGSGGYDLMGLTRQQVIDDMLDRYEAHLAFLTFSSETDTASVLTPAVLPKDQRSPIPKGADDIEDLGDGKD